jgi:N-hydroxyarylamine O-acetyltransferase
VGFGNSPLEPIALEAGAESTQGAWRYRLTRESQEWVLHSWHEDRWKPVHAFTEAARYPIDFLVTNHFMATHPDSHFHGRVRAQRMSADELTVLDGTRLTTHRPPAGREDRHLTPAEVITALADVFAVVLDDDDAKTVITALGG